MIKKETFRLNSKCSERWSQSNLYQHGQFVSKSDVERGAKLRGLLEVKMFE